MEILRVEFQQKNDCDSCLSLNTDTPDIQNAGDKPDKLELKVDKPEGDSGDSVDVLEVMPQRVCGVIQAYYLVCASLDYNSERWDYSEIGLSLISCSICPHNKGRHTVVLLSVGMHQILRGQQIIIYKMDFSQSFTDD